MEMEFVTTDATESGELELGGDGTSLPADFPTVTSGVEVLVGTDLSRQRQLETDND